MESVRETQASVPNGPNGQIVGREADIAQLERCLNTALDGERQLVFVTGEPGIGKTTLVETFLASLPPRQDLRLGHGQCIEQYGAGEAYLPILEAINRLSQGSGGERLIEVLRQHAPTWLVQLPSLVEEADREALQRQVQGSTQERMLREMAEALVALTAEHGLVLVLEDLHWSDVSTLELLAYLARRQEPARLCIIGTYRAAEVRAHNSPLKGIVQELQARSLCQELPLTPLSEAAIAAYVTYRLGRVPTSGTLPDMIYHRTEGNPLFMVTTVDYLTRQGLLVEEAGGWTFKDTSEDAAHWVPEDLRQLIEKQIDSLPTDTQHLLEVGSVVGMEFSVAAVAAGLTMEVEGIETQCSRLARQGHFLQEHGLEEWPDGTLGGRYRFLHALYQNVLYDRLSRATQVRLHRQVGSCKETAYGERAHDIAAELAVHFEQGRVYPKAVQCHYQAGKNAVRRHAHVEAIEHFQTGLSFVEFLTDAQEGARQELVLQSALGSSLMLVRGYAVDEIEQIYLRVRELSQQLGDPIQLFRGQYGLATYYLIRAQYQTAAELADQLLLLGDQLGDLGLRVMARQMAGLIAFCVGELATAQTHLTQALRLYDPERHSGLLAIATYCRDYVALTSWFQGHPDRAVQQAHEALQLTQDQADLHALSVARSWAAGVHILCRQGGAAQAQLQLAFSLSQTQAFAFMATWQTILHSAARTMQGASAEGVAGLHTGLTACDKTGIYQFRSWFLVFLAEAYRGNGQPQEALRALEEALVFMQDTGERIFEAELHRLKGELLRAQESKSRKSKVKSQAEAEACFQQALAIARRQAAKSWELRAATSLGRLWQEQGKTDEARQLLEEIYSWFTEGFETQDLQDAEALLKSLGSQIERKVLPTPAESLPQAFAAPPDEKTLPLLDTLPTRQPHVYAASSTKPTISAAADSSVAEPSAAETSAAESIFRQEGEYWTVAFEGQVSRVKDVRGMHYLAQLLSHPSEEFHVLALAGEGQPQNVAAGTQRSAAVENESFQQGFTDGGDVLDPEARGAYRKRMQELQAELEEAHEFNDLGRIERLQEELDFLSQELSLAVGLGGRARKTNSPADRARSAVSKSIRTALRRIAKSHPPLGDYLRHTVRTGMFCRYAPDPRASFTWHS